MSTIILKIIIALCWTAIFITNVIKGQIDVTSYSFMYAALMVVTIGEIINEANHK